MLTYAVLFHKIKLFKTRIYMEPMLINVVDDLLGITNKIRMMVTSLYNI